MNSDKNIEFLMKIYNGAAKKYAQTEKRNIAYGMVIFRKNSLGDIEFLVTKPSGYNDPYSPPKGRGEPGEDPKIAAEREVVEETGLSVKNIGYLGETEFHSQYSGRKFVALWLGEFISGNVDENGNCPDHDWENEVVQFVSLEKASSLLRPEYVSAYRKAYDMISKEQKNIEEEIDPINPTNNINGGEQNGI
jgi:8-oxo-dGTP diphosphatase